MAHIRPFVKINIIGTAYQGQEIWNTGFNIIHGPGDEITQQNLDDYAEGVAGLWQTVFSASGNAAFSSAYATEMVKASYIANDGKVLNDMVAEYYYPEPIYGVRGGEGTYAQIATVVTFRSAVRKGPAALGRMYLPTMALPPSPNTGLWPAGNIAQLRDRMVTFFQGVNDLALYEGGFGLTSPVGEGRQARVIAIGIDNKPDTQRRRANSLIHDLTLVPLEEDGS